MALWVPQGRDALLGNAELCAALHEVLERPKTAEAEDR